MGRCRNIRMRRICRYFVYVLSIVLIYVPIHLVLISEKHVNIQKLLVFNSKIEAVPRISSFSNKVTSEVNDHQRNSSTEWMSHPMTITWKEYQSNLLSSCGNPLIDTYGSNDPSRMGEYGSGIILVGSEKEKSKEMMAKHNLNVYVSDCIPLNRMVPDVRFPGCGHIRYPKELPSASIVVPFYDEWPSILLRTIYSIVNRTPRKLLQEILLVDDGSTMSQLKDDLDRYVDTHFPKGLVKIIRVPERRGLIQARLMGFENSTGDVIIFFDSHMEVNIDWLQPLLAEISKDRKTVAMGVLDYIHFDTMEYKYYSNQIVRYGFDWRLNFFEKHFRKDQIGRTPEEARPGTVMVGAAYAIDRKYFKEMGTYDNGMMVWGGENLEMAWRIWLCGGRMVHVPCSHIGHVERAQPYTFPGGRNAITQYNYKRAIEVWMEPEHKEIVYDHFPDMRTLDAGDLSERMRLKEKLQCKPFSWFINHVWPELFVLHRNVTAWGSARNLHTNRCLDNHWAQKEAPLYADTCHYKLATQGFSLTKDKLLRTSLQCVVIKSMTAGARPELEDCITGPRDTWTHKQGSQIVHEATGLCLDLDNEGPIMMICDDQAITQMWQFNTYVV